MYKHILVPIKLGDDGVWRDSLDKAVGLAQTFGAKLSLLAVVPELGVGMVSSFFPPDYAAQARGAAEAGIAEVAAKHVPDGVETDTFVTEGKVWREIVRVAGEGGIDLVVVGGRPHEPIDGFLLGTTAQRVAQKARPAVLIVR